MPARADARYPHPIGIDSIVGCMRVHEPNRGSNLFHNFRNLVSGLGSMNDLEHGEAVVDKDLLDLRHEALKHGMIRDPASAHHEDHRRFVLFCGTGYIHRKSGSAGLHVDHVLSPGLSRRQGSQEQQEDEGKSR